MQNLTGTAVVTGGGAGIGRSLCVALAAEGMEVVVVDRDSGRAEDVAGEIVSTGGRAHVRQCDVTDAAAVQALADGIFDALGNVTILCNNAGVVQSGPLAEAPLEDWDWVLGVNLFGVVHGIRAFVPRMQVQRHGHIVNSASLSGLFTLPGYGVYAASKYAVVALSETLRTELKPYGLGVSVLCPGPVQTRIDEATRVRGVVERDFDNGPPALGFRDADDVAAIVIDAIRADRLYVGTHADGISGVEMRFESIMADLHA